MLDVSDGLVQDLGHIAAASGVRIEVDPAALPVPEIIASAAGGLGADPLDWILTGGEDHALAAVFPPHVRLGAAWTIIGTVGKGGGVGVVGRHTIRGGWNHFG
jgi:thiamine-monophosphate kinase